MRKTLAWFLLILPSFGSAANAATTLSMQLNAEPVSLDPARAEDGISLKILGNTSEGLVGYDGSGALVNRLAESYVVSANGLHYEFNLRRDAKWSDGKPVTAAELVAGIQRSLDPKTASKLAALLKAVDHVGEKDGKLVIDLKERTPYFIQALTLSVAFPVRQDVLEAGHGSWPATAPSTGPYRIAQVLSGQKIILEKNPHYYGPKGGPDRVEILIVADESTGAHLFDQGKIDILTRVPTYDFPGYVKKGLARSDPFFATFYLSFNTRKAPFSDRELRRAVAGAIRKREITDALKTGETPARSWIPLGIEGYQPYDEKASAAVFAGSVEKFRKAGPKSPVEAGFDSSSRNSMILEKIQHDLKTGLGLEVSLQNLDWRSYIRAIATDPFPIFRFGWLAPFKDPISHLEAFTTGNPNNYSGWSNNEYDRLVSEIGHEKPGRARLEKIRRAQKILVEDEAAVVPIFHYVQNHAVSRRVKGFRVNPFGVIFFNELELAEAK